MVAWSLPSRDWALRHFTILIPFKVWGMRIGSLWWWEFTKLSIDIESCFGVTMTRLIVLSICWLKLFSLLMGKNTRQIQQSWANPAALSQRGSLSLHSVKTPAQSGGSYHRVTKCSQVQARICPRSVNTTRELGAAKPFPLAMKRYRNHTRFSSAAVPEARDVNNRCNLRWLSIFQITDKHIAGDCS